MVQANQQKHLGVSINHDFYLGFCLILRSAERSSCQMKLWGMNEAMAVLRQERARDTEGKRESSGRGQPSGLEIRFLSSQWRAIPLSSISKISSVVRIRPRHRFLSHGSTCSIGPSQERRCSEVVCGKHLHTSCIFVHNVFLLISSQELLHWSLFYIQ